MPVTLKSSTEWLQEPEFQGIAVVDPDGWDRRNYNASLAELITLEEFRSRLNRSTVFRMQSRAESQGSPTAP